MATFVAVQITELPEKLKTTRILVVFIAKVSLRIKYENSVRAKETVVTRLRFGTCLTNEFLKKINAVTCLLYTSPSPRD